IAPTPAAAAGTAAPTARNLLATATPHAVPSVATMEKVTARSLLRPHRLRPMRIGVLTGGGDCPGLNAVIRGIVRKGSEVYGHDFVGFRDGWKGPLEGLTMPLDVSTTRGILPRGGTILGSSRTNPIKIDGGVDRIEQTIQSLGVDGLIAIGGEDTLGVATTLSEHGLTVVGVPKTIDNGLNATDYTFGFETAVQIAVDA